MQQQQGHALRCHRLQGRLGTNASSSLLTRASYYASYYQSVAECMVHGGLQYWTVQLLEADKRLAFDTKYSHNVVPRQSIITG